MSSREPIQADRAGPAGEGGGGGVFPEGVSMSDLIVRHGNWIEKAQERSEFKLPRKGPRRCRKKGPTRGKRRLFLKVNRQEVKKSGKKENRAMRKAPVRGTLQNNVPSTI